ncbi:MAG: PEGA domain-containing protein [Patescibacteria group bacterium]
MDELKNQSGGGKTPDEELAELLRQSQVRTPKISLAPKLPNIGRPRTTKINWGVIAIGGLAAILVFGTGYFLLNGIQFNVGELTLELNQEGVHLTVDDRSYGEVDSGEVLKLTAGAHRLALAKDGFLELEQTVTIVRKEKSEMSFELLPIPVIERKGETTWQDVRLSKDGNEIAYFDPQDKTFKLLKLEDDTTVALFRGSFANVSDVAWSPASSAAIVKMAGRVSLTNMLDNRGVKGRYVVLGERPEQGAAKYNGTTTWLFDDDLKEAVGWQPVLLNDSIRQVAFGASGDEIVYVYDTADGEYSLVRALPDGQEWERVIIDLPSLGDAKLVWSPDDRYLVIDNGQSLLLADLVAKTVTAILEDWVSGSRYQFSPDGGRLAYLANDDGGIKLKIYDFTNDEAKILERVAARSDMAFTWLHDQAIVVVTANQSFEKVNLETEDKTIIPFVGSESDLQIRSMSYSLIGQTLMLVADTGIFVMKI